MGVKFPELDEIHSVAMPYHGLWKGGVITLPNATTKACAAPSTGSCVLLRVPDIPAVDRTEAELEADDLAGLEYRDYGLISGGRIGGINLSEGSGFARILFIDSAKVRWLVRITRDFVAVNKYLLTLQRFGHIDGTAAAVSSPLEVMLYVDILRSISSPGDPYTIAQNTSGTEFILGAGSWMIKMTLAGTVDLDVAGFGLTITSDIFEYRYRKERAISASTNTSGICVDTTVQNLYLVQVVDGVEYPTGETYTRTVVREDGVITEDNGAPSDVPGFSWYGGTTYTHEATKTQVILDVDSSRKYIWAAYLEDVLKLISIEFVITYSGTAIPFYVEASLIGPHWSWDGGGTTTTIKSLISKIGDSVIFSHSETSSGITLGREPLSFSYSSNADLDSTGRCNGLVKSFGGCCVV